MYSSSYAKLELGREKKENHKVVVIFHAAFCRRPEVTLFVMCENEVQKIFKTMLLREVLSNLCTHSGRVMGSVSIVDQS